jgi:hypothetical protein
MRMGLALLACLAPGALLHAQQDQEVTPPKRYGVILKLESYPQSDYKQALASVLKAVENQRIDYLLAHLADPDWVDERVKETHGGDFDAMVKETTTKLSDNPTAVKEIERFLKEGEWEEKGTSATARLKDVKDRQVFMKKIGKRWYLENKQKAETSK